MTKYQIYIVENLELFLMLFLQIDSYLLTKRSLNPSLSMNPDWYSIIYNLYYKPYNYFIKLVFFILFLN